MERRARLINENPNPLKIDIQYNYDHFYNYYMLQLITKTNVKTETISQVS